MGDGRFIAVEGGEGAKVSTSAWAPHASERKLDREGNRRAVRPGEWVALQGKTETLASQWLSLVVQGMGTKG